MASTAIGRIISTKIGPFRGMNEKVSPDTLPADVAADLQNVLLDETPGTAVKCQGSRAQAELPSGLPPRDTYVFTKLDGTSYQLVSDGSTLYYTTDPSGASFYVSLKTGLNPDGFMEFETAENKVWMSNGIDAVMSWDGSTLIIFDRSFTSTTNLTTVDSTHIIHAGLTSSDDYWNGMKLVFTVGANVGTVVTVTDYVEATKELTFTPAVAGIAATDRFMVGVIIPKGAALRYYDGHLFVGCTADNQAELRFSEISDPNTGAVMNLDNPQAWPAENELALNVLDQEKLWGISPILRDRILVHKATGVWRLERDPLVIYRLEVVSRSVGSRFPDTWAEKKGLLYFLGQDKDGLPEIYKTDMVDISLVDPDGGVEPTLRDLQQPNAVQQTRVFTSTTDFDAGTKSTGTSTVSGQLGILPDLPAFTSNSNADSALPGGLAGYHGLLGNVNWIDRYDVVSGVKPSADTPAWTETGGWQLTGAELYYSGSGVGERSYNRASVLSSTENAIMSVRAIMNSGGTFAGSSFFIKLSNGAKQCWLTIFYNIGTGLWQYGKSGDSGLTSSGALPFSDTAYHIFTMQLLTDGTFKIWVDGVLWLFGTGYSSTTNEVRFGASATTTFAADPPLQSLGTGTRFTKSFFSSNSNDGVPSTIPVTGNFVVQYDFTRVPDALHKFFYSSTDYGATIVLSSWTSDTPDFSTGNDGAGYIVFANGAQPTSTIKRYMRIKVTITTVDVMGAPNMTAFYAGMLWTSPSVQVGSAISAWRTFLDTIATPVGVDQSIQIRRATVTTTPVEGDYGAWFAIVNGNNIGTILSDAVPTSRWVQLKVEQGPSAVGLLPLIDSMVINWTEGSTGNLPVRAIVHKKRYIITAASSTAATNDILIVSDRNDQWTKFRGLSLNAMIHYKGNLYGLDAAAATQRMMDIDGLYNHDGVAIDAFLVSREEDFGQGHLRKNLRYSYIEWDRAAGTATLTTYYRRTGESSFTGTVTLNFGTTGTDVRQNFPIAIVGKRIQRKYRNAVLDENIALMNEVVYADIRPPQP